MTKIGWWYNSPANCCLSLILQRSCCCRFFFLLSRFFFSSSFVRLFVLSFFLSFFLDTSSSNDRKRERGEYYSLHRNICASVCLATHSNNIYLYPIIHRFSLLRLSELYVYTGRVGGERERETENIGFSLLMH